MCAACQTEYQEIRNLFNHANMRAEITNTIFLYIIPLSPLARFYTFFGYTLPLSLSVLAF